MEKNGAAFLVLESKQQKSAMMALSHFLFHSLVSQQDC